MDKLSEVVEQFVLLKRDLEQRILPFWEVIISLEKKSRSHYTLNPAPDNVQVQNDGSVRLGNCNMGEWVNFTLLPSDLDLSPQDFETLFRSRHLRHFSGPDTTTSAHNKNKNKCTTHD